MTRETYAVAPLGQQAHGWLVDAESAGEAGRIVHGTVPRAHEVWECDHERDGAPDPTRHSVPGQRDPGPQTHALRNPCPGSEGDY